MGQGWDGLPEIWTFFRPETRSEENFVYPTRLFSQPIPSLIDWGCLSKGYHLFKVGTLVLGFESGRVRVIFFGPHYVLSSRASSLIGFPTLISIKEPHVIRNDFSSLKRISKSDVKNHFTFFKKELIK
uniref:Uncharacterized protein n=1 Tax=Meloidogyne enterolobii TaxID=390850 RepID=A0A6V7VS94_MELEN|nr:unnamed protein product [Meloidogyne enterolobii]